jgi:hypothetical protein
VEALCGASEGGSVRVLVISERAFQVVLAIFSTMLGLIAGIFATRLQRDRRRLQYTIRADTRLLGGETEDFRGDIELFHDGKRIEDPQLLIIHFENSGNRPILPSDYYEPISFDLTTGQVLSVGITQKSEESIDSHVSVQSQTISLDPLLMNPKDWIDLKILTDGPAGNVSARSRIAGVGTITRYPSRWESILVPQTASLIMVIALIEMLVIIVLVLSLLRS